MSECVALRDAIKIRVAMEDYQDKVYINLIRQLNTNCQEVLQQDLGSQFIKNCGRDLAGEVVRNYFDTSDYYITVDQLARRILEFSYEHEYDPLSDKTSDEMIRKNAYNVGTLKSSEMDKVSRMIAGSQEKLFTVDRKADRLDIKGKRAYRESRVDSEGDIYDELTGRKGEQTQYMRNGREVTASDLHADHVQSREAASYNSRYLDESGREQLREFWNSSDNMQMMHQSANTSKGDVRVCEVDGEIIYVNARSNEYNPETDITYKASPEQLADAVCKQWESIIAEKEQKNQPKIEILKEKGYLDEEGKVRKSVRNELIENIRHSQNVESRFILRNTDYGKVAQDAVDMTKGAMGKIIAGQIIYYAAPPLVYELRTILKDKSLKLENVLDKLSASAKRIGNYVFSKLKNIFANIVSNSLKKFIKSFMDILIGTVKATVKKLLKMAKNVVLSTVEAIRIIADKNTSSTEKANAVFNLYGVTITTCVVEILFELLAESLHIPEPFDDIIFGPLQILATVVCTNLTLLILQKADLFDIQYGFKISQIKRLFAETQEAYNAEYNLSTQYADSEIALIIERARKESIAIYENLEALDVKHQSVRSELEKVNTMFSINIDFEADWLKFLGITRGLHHEHNALEYSENLKDKTIFEMRIEYCFGVSDGVVDVRGQIQEGVVRLGDKMELRGQGDLTPIASVQEIYVNGEKADIAKEGDKVRLFLDGVNQNQIKIGNKLVIMRV